MTSKWLGVERWHRYTNRGKILDLKLQTHARSTQLLNPDDMLLFLESTDSRKLTLFNKLRQVKHSVTFASSPSVFNMSSDTFSENELCLLSCGKKFAVTPVDKLSSIHATIVTDIVAEIWNNQRLNSSKITSLINDMVKGLSAVQNPDAQAFISLRSCIWKENLVLVNADKGNASVVMERSSYIECVHTFIKVSKAEKLKRFLFDVFNSKIWAAISSSIIVIPQAKKHVYQKSYAVLHLYGPLKTHKPEQPLRPVIRRLLYLSYFWFG